MNRPLYRSYDWDGEWRKRVFGKMKVYHGVNVLGLDIGDSYMKSVWILVIGCILTGCMKQGQRQVQRLERLYGMSMSNILANDQALKELSAKVGMVFPAYSVLVSSTNETWCVRSEDELRVPGTSTKGTNSLPLAETVDFVQGKSNGQTITHPESAFSSEWNTNGLKFKGTVVRSKNGDWIVIEKAKF